MTEKNDVYFHIKATPTVKRKFTKKAKEMGVTESFITRTLIKMFLDGKIKLEF